MSGSERLQEFRLHELEVRLDSSMHELEERLDVLERQLGKLISKLAWLLEAYPP